MASLGHCLRIAANSLIIAIIAYNVSATEVRLNGPPNTSAVSANSPSTASSSASTSSAASITYDATNGPASRTSADPGDASCINDAYSYKPTTWNETFVYEAPARLFVQKKWQSSGLSPIRLTIATHLTMQRLNQLAAQCEGWEGSLVAVVYLPVLQPPNQEWLGSRGQKAVTKAQKALDKFHKKVSDTLPCKMDLMLVWEAITQSNLTLLYPYNVLRNTAIMQVKTPLVAMLDVDLVPSANLAAELKDQAAMDRLQALCAQKIAVVLPALEIVPPPGSEANPNDPAVLENMRSRFDEAIKGGKTTVRGMWGTNSIRGFDMVNFPRGHNPTDYNHWLANDEYYPITYSWEYEPWYIVDRRLNWWYDVRFRAYFFDKSIQLASMVRLGDFKLKGHPTAFLVHRPHPKPAIKSNTETFQNILRVMKPRAGLAWMEMWDGWYRVIVAPVLKGCLEAMPWWAVEEKDTEYWKWSFLYPGFAGTRPIGPYV